jgi:hypothetical protein
MRSNRLTLAVAAAVLTGGAAVALIFGAATAMAASPTPSTQPAASAVGTQTTGGNPFGRTETVSDASIMAGVIGISEADLNTALSGGQTVAAVAKAHNVDPQKIIDALTTDGLNELAAQVTAGTLTQTQADAQKAEVTQRATDQVNGTLRGGPGGGPRGAGGAACPAAVPSASAVTN